MPDQRVTFFLYKGGACCGLVIDPKIPYSILLEGQIGLSANFQMEDLVCVSISLSPMYYVTLVVIQESEVN